MIELWMEGYRCNGDQGHAFCLGEFEGSNIDEAVANWLLQNPREKGCYRYSEKTKAHLSWGCQIFDNKEDARKLNG